MPSWPRYSTNHFAKHCCVCIPTMSGTTTAVSQTTSPRTLAKNIFRRKKMCCPLPIVERLGDLWKRGDRRLVLAAHDRAQHTLLLRATVTLLPPGRHHLLATNNNNKKRLAYSCICLLYTSPSPRDRQKSRMPSSA